MLSRLYNENVVALAKGIKRLVKKNFKTIAIITAQLAVFAEVQWKGFFSWNIPIKPYDQAFQSLVLDSKQHQEMCVIQ